MRRNVIPNMGVHRRRISDFAIFHLFAIQHLADLPNIEHGPTTGDALVNFFIRHIGHLFVRFGGKTVEVLALKGWPKPFGPARYKILDPGVSAQAASVVVALATIKQVALAFWLAFILWRRCVVAHIISVWAHLHRVSVNMGKPGKVFARTRNMPIRSNHELDGAFRAFQDKRYPA